MSFYDPAAPGADFGIALTHTTPLLARFHRTLMDRRATPVWAEFDPAAYEPGVLEYARRQWAQRAVAEYQSTAQFGELLHRLTKIGAPLEMIGAATRLAQDECRHAELCAQFADLLGGRDDYLVQSGLSLFEELDDELLAVYMTLLTVCCFGETISVPMLRALHAVSVSTPSRAGVSGPSVPLFPKSGSEVGPHEVGAQADRGADQNRSRSSSKFVRRASL